MDIIQYFVIFLWCTIASAVESYLDNSERLHLVYTAQEEGTAPKTLGNIGVDSRLQQRHGLANLEGVTYRLLPPKSQQFNVSSTGQFLVMDTLDRDQSSCDQAISYCNATIDVGITLRDNSFEVIFITVMVSQMYPTLSCIMYITYFTS